jgi:hypothetical protein
MLVIWAAFADIAALSTMLRSVPLGNPEIAEPT